MLTQFTRAYAQLTPPESIVFRITSKQIARRRRAGLGRRLAFAAVIAMLLLSGWHWRGRVIEWFGKLRNFKHAGNAAGKRVMDDSSLGAVPGSAGVDGRMPVYHAHELPGL